MKPQDRYAAASWAPEDEELLLAERKAGLSFDEIQAKHFPNRTRRAVKARHSLISIRRGERATLREPEADAWRKHCELANIAFLKALHASLSKRGAVRRAA